MGMYDKYAQRAESMSCRHVCEMIATFNGPLDIPKLFVVREVLIRKFVELDQRDKKFLVDEIWHKQNRMALKVLEPILLKEHYLVKDNYGISHLSDEWKEYSNEDKLNRYD